MAFRRSVVTMLCCAAPMAAAAQAPPRPEAAALAEGWTLLAKGDAANASRVAAEELARNRASVAALQLQIDAEIARGGAAASMSAYDKWLGSRGLDAPFALRRIARASLVESSGKSSLGARLDALKALAADGDPQAQATLEQGLTAKSFGEARALAANGNARAVKMLLDQLATTPGPKTMYIDALGDTGSKLAIAALKPLLSDPLDVNRASAADALGRLGATDAVPQLKPLLNDPVFTVKLKAAGALFRLNDTSGLSLLTDLSQNEHAGIRIAAAKEMASQPDPSWQAAVRALTSDSDPVVRLDAARLIAPYDQPLANTVLQSLLRDDNMAIREAASETLADRVASDFLTLRQLLHNPDVVIRVKAAARILELTR